VVGLAKILGRKDEIATRVSENLQFLESMKDPGLPNFKRFVASIGVKI
jgi:hypothetical protein